MFEVGGYDRVKNRVWKQMQSVSEIVGFVDDLSNGNFLCNTQMWMNVLRKATAAKAVPTVKEASSAGVSKAMSCDLTNGAAKL